MIIKHILVRYVSVSIDKYSIPLPFRYRLLKCSRKLLSGIRRRGMFSSDSKIYTNCERTFLFQKHPVCSKKNIVYLIPNSIYVSKLSLFLYEIECRKQLLYYCRTVFGTLRFSKLDLWPIYT